MPTPTKLLPVLTLAVLALGGCEKVASKEPTIPPCARRLVDLAGPEPEAPQVQAPPLKV
jgi:hypothetical protein